MDANCLTDFQSVKARGSLAWIDSLSTFWQNNGQGVAEGLQIPDEGNIVGRDSQYTPVFLMD